jgi:hypothetical protein
MRARSMVGLLAFVLAVALIGAGTAVAQTPVVPATTSAPPKDEKAKPEKPKVEEPKVQEPTVQEPTVQEPTVQEPTVEKPTVEKPKVEKPKVEKPKPEKPTVHEPETDKPKPEKPTVEEPKAEKPMATPKRPRPRIHADTPRAQPNEPAPEPQVEVATTVSPTPTAAPSFAASGATTASPQPLETDSAGRDANRPATVVPIRGSRLASDEVTEAAVVPIDRQSGRVLALDSLPRYNVAPLLLTVFLAVVFAIGLGYHIRRDLRGSPSTAPLRRQPPARALRRRPTVHPFSERVRSSIADWSAGISAGISTARGRSPTRRTPSFESGSRIRPGAMRPHGGRRSTSTARGRTALAAQRLSLLWRSPGPGRSR